MKFNRGYEIQILTPTGELITITPPFSVQFQVTRNTLASANKCNLTIYNLGKLTRQRIFKDRYSIAEYWQLVIKSGYGGRLETVFQGNIYESLSYKEKTEWVTKIDAFDGLNGINNGFTNRTINKNSDKKNVISGIISDMPNIIQGVLGDPSTGSNDRGKVLLGQSSKVLSEETDGQYFIDNEKLNVVSDDEFLPGSVIVLDSAQLLSTPKRRDTFIDCDILFLPEAKIGLLCEIRSLVEIYNGQYKVMGFNHNVTISGATNGTALTKISLYAGAAGLKETT